MNIGPHMVYICYIYTGCPKKMFPFDFLHEYLYLGYVLYLFGIHGTNARSLGPFWTCWFTSLRAGGPGRFQKVWVWKTEYSWTSLFHNMSTLLVFLTFQTLEEGMKSIRLISNIILTKYVPQMGIWSLKPNQNSYLLDRPLQYPY